MELARIEKITGLNMETESEVSEFIEIYQLVKQKHLEGIEEYSNVFQKFRTMEIIISCVKQNYKSVIELLIPDIKFVRGFFNILFRLTSLYKEGYDCEYLLRIIFQKHLNPSIIDDHYESNILHMCLRKNPNEKLINIILDYVSDCNKQDRHGMTEFMLACRYLSLDTIKRMKEKQGIFHRESFKYPKHTALTYAIFGMNHEVANYIYKYYPKKYLEKHKELIFTDFVAGLLHKDDKKTFRDIVKMMEIIMTRIRSMKEIYEYLCIGFKNNVEYLDLVAKMYENRNIPSDNDHAIRLFSAVRRCLMNNSAKLIYSNPSDDDYDCIFKIMINENTDEKLRRITNCFDGLFPTTVFKMLRLIPNPNMLIKRYYILEPFYYYWLKENMSVQNVNFVLEEWKGVNIFIPPMDEFQGTKTQVSSLYKLISKNLDHVPIEIYRILLNSHVNYIGDDEYSDIIKETELKLHPVDKIIKYKQDTSTPLDFIETNQNISECFIHQCCIGNLENVKAIVKLAKTKKIMRTRSLK